MSGQTFSVKYTPELFAKVEEAAANGHIKAFEVELPYDGKPEITITPFGGLPMAGMAPEIASLQLQVYQMAAKKMADKIGEDLLKLTQTFPGDGYASGGMVHSSSFKHLVGEKPSAYLLSPKSAEKLKLELLKSAPVMYPEPGDNVFPTFAGVKIIPHAGVKPGEAYMVGADFGKTPDTFTPPSFAADAVAMLVKGAGFHVDEEAMGQMKAHMDELIDNTTTTPQPAYLLYRFDSTLVPDGYRLAIDTSDWTLWAREGDGKWYKQGFDQAYAAQLSEAITYARGLRETNKAYSFDLSVTPDQTTIALFHNGKLYNHVPVPHPKTSADYPLKTMSVEVKFNTLEDYPNIIAQGAPLESILPKWATDHTRFSGDCPDILSRRGFLKIAMELWEDMQLRQLLLSVVVVQGVISNPKLQTIELHCVSPQFEVSPLKPRQYIMQVQEYDTFPQFWFEEFLP